MEVGEVWAYRERVNDPGCLLLPAEITQFGPPRSHKVRVRMRAGEYPGLDRWVPKLRLVATWVEADAWLADERRYGAVREASRDPVDSVEHRAALKAVFVHPMPDGILMGYSRAEGAIIETSDLAAVCRDLGLDEEALLDEPLAFVDRHGTYIAPWNVAQRIAVRVAQRYAAVLLKAIDTEESELREEAVRGKWAEWTKGKQFLIPAERCAELLREEEPVFALVRSWCGAESVSQFDENRALRTELDRLRSIVEETARLLDDRGLTREAARLRKKARRPAQ